MAAELSVGAYVKVVGGTGGLNGELGTIKRIDSRRFQVELKKEGKTIWREAAQLEKQPEPEVVRPRAGSVKDVAQKFDKVEIGNKTPAERPLSRGGSQGCAGSNDRPAAPAETPEEEPLPLGEAGRTGSVLDRAKRGGGGDDEEGWTPGPSVERTPAAVRGGSSPQRRPHSPVPAPESLPPPPLVSSGGVFDPVNARQDLRNDNADTPYRKAQMMKCQMVIAQQGEHRPKPGTPASPEPGTPASPKKVSPAELCFDDDDDGASAAPSDTPAPAPARAEDSSAHPTASMSRSLPAQEEAGCVCAVL